MGLASSMAAKIAAKSSFKLKDPKFIEIYNNVEESDTQDGEEVDIRISMSASYEGEPPNSFRVINSMIMDFTEDNLKELGKLAAPPLKKFLPNIFPELDLSPLDEDPEDFIWEEQVDFSPEIDEENKLVIFDLEIVLDLDEAEEQIETPQ